MTTHSIDDKKQQILDHETMLAQLLARQVIDKPKPPLWMIFVPVFFVFFIQKMNQYKSGLEDFVENYLKSRRRALEAAVVAAESDITVDMEALLEKIGNVPQQARPLFTEWMDTLIEHYLLLLTSPGSDHSALVHNAYRNKTNYLLFCNCLNKAENAYNVALLPEMQKDSQDIHHIIQKMDICVTNLRRQEADAIFS
jgi:hypothetical protein